MDDFRIHPSQAVMKITPEPKRTIQFMRDGRLLGTLFFEAEGLRFEGDADASAKVFIDGVGSYWGVTWQVVSNAEHERDRLRAELAVERRCRANALLAADTGREWLEAADGLAEVVNTAAEYSVSDADQAAAQAALARWQAVRGGMA